MWTEPLMTGGLIVLVTMMGLTALIVGTAAHAKGVARGYAQGHLAGHLSGLEQGRNDGHQAGYTAGLADARRPQPARTPHLAHWEHPRMAQVATARLQPAPKPHPTPVGQDERGKHWSTGTVHTQALPAIPPKDGT